MQKGCIYCSSSFGRGGGPLAVEEIVYMFNLPPPSGTPSSQEGEFLRLQRGTVL